MTVKRRVAHVVQPTVGGVPSVVLALAEEGRRQGHEVVVFSPRGGDLEVEARAAGLTWKPMEMARRPSLADLRAVLSLRTVLRSFDIVHLHSSKAAAVGRLARLLAPGRAKVVVVPHAWSWFVGGRLRWLYRAFERMSYRLADVIVAVSDGEQAAGARVLGSRAPIVVIHNGVDVDRFRPGAGAAVHGRTSVLVIGRLCEQKGQDRALRALALLPSSFEIVLVGEGPDRNALGALAQHLGVESRVTFVGNVEPLPYFRVADIVLVPSRWEGLSLAMLEAMACGRPVVATAVSGAEVIDGAGVLLPLDATPAQIAAALVQLAADEARRDELGAIARRTAVDRFSTRHMLDDYSSLWNELAG